MEVIFVLRNRMTTSLNETPSKIKLKISHNLSNIPVYGGARRWINPYNLSKHNYLKNSKGFKSV